jgi:hypothetical protein
MPLNVPWLHCTVWVGNWQGWRGQEEEVDFLQILVDRHIISSRDKVSQINSHIAENVIYFTLDDVA